MDITGVNHQLWGSCQSSRMENCHFLMYSHQSVDTEEQSLQFIFSPSEHLGPLEGRLWAAKLLLTPVTVSDIRILFPFLFKIRAKHRNASLQIYPQGCFLPRFVEPPLSSVTSLRSLRS